MPCVGRITLRVIRRLTLAPGRSGLSWKNAWLECGAGEGMGVSAYNRERLYALPSPATGFDVDL